MDITKEFIIQVGDDLPPIENTSSDVVIVTNLINDKDDFYTAFKKLRTLYYEKQNKTYIFSDRILFILQKLMIEKIKSSYVEFINALDNIEGFKNYFNDYNDEISNKNSYFDKYSFIFPGDESNYKYLIERIENKELGFPDFLNIHTIIKKIALDLTNVYWCNLIFFKYVKGELACYNINTNILVDIERIGIGFNKLILKKNTRSNTDEDFLVERIFNLPKEILYDKYETIINIINAEENPNIRLYHVILHNILSSLTLYQKSHDTSVYSLSFIKSKFDDNYNSSFFKNDIWNNYDSFLKMINVINFNKDILLGSNTALNIYLTNNSTINKPFTYKRLANINSSINIKDYSDYYGNGGKFYIFNENYKGFYKMTINYKTGDLQLTPIKNVT